MSPIPPALYAKSVRLWSQEEKRAHLDEYRRQLVEARDTVKQLMASPEFHTPEVQAQIKAMADKFHMQLGGQAPPAVPQSQPAASAAVSVPQPSSKPAASSDGFLDWLSNLFRRPSDDGTAAEQQDEPQRTEGQWTHIGQAPDAAPSPLSLVSHCPFIDSCAFPFLSLCFFSVFFFVQSARRCCLLRLPSLRMQKGCAAVMRTPISNRGGAAEGGVGSCFQLPLCLQPAPRLPSLMRAWISFLPVCLAQRSALLLPPPFRSLPPFCPCGCFLLVPSFLSLCPSSS
jgi:hypothetical protein